MLELLLLMGLGALALRPEKKDTLIITDDPDTGRGLEGGGIITSGLDIDLDEGKIERYPTSGLDNEDWGGVDDIGGVPIAVPNKEGDTTTNVTTTGTTPLSDKYIKEVSDTRDKVIKSIISGADRRYPQTLDPRTRLPARGTLTSQKLETGQISGLGRVTESTS